MKVLLIFLLLCSPYAYGQVPLPKNNQSKSVNHQGRFLLKNINEARRILASGLLHKITDFLGINLPSLGPAANMYRMKWSRQLEGMAQKHIESVKFDPLTLFGEKNIEGFRVFYWLHDFSGVVKRFLKDHNLPGFETIEKILNSFKTALEALMFIIWAFSKAIGNFPNITTPLDGSTGPLEVFFADRYEFGCAFKVYAMCFIRDGQHELLYKRGVPCTQCPTFCEFTENLDGTIDEGDLCVPPTTTKLAPAPMPEFEFDSTPQLNFFLIFVILCLSKMLWMY